jgi:hypothetical protein
MICKRLKRGWLRILIACVATRNHRDEAFDGGISPRGMLDAEHFRDSPHFLPEDSFCVVPFATSLDIFLLKY